MDVITDGRGCSVGGCRCACGGGSAAVFGWGLATLGAGAFLVTLMALMRPNAVVESAPVDIRSHRVNLNRAGAAELAALPEIGPSLAKVIVADRSARGAFATVDELTRVRGVGPATVEAVRPLATVGDADPADGSPTAGPET